jgi:hypothetical protein
MIHSGFVSFKNPFSLQKKNFTHYEAVWFEPASTTQIGASQFFGERFARPRVGVKFGCSD